METRAFFLKRDCIVRLTSYTKRKFTIVSKILYRNEGRNKTRLHHQIESRSMETRPLSKRCFIETSALSKRVLYRNERSMVETRLQLKQESFKTGALLDWNSQNESPLSKRVLYRNECFIKTSALSKRESYVTTRFLYGNESPLSQQSSKQSTTEATVAISNGKQS
jgi:hypothetical protein